MANEKILGILRKGVEAWNQWRMDSYHIKPDLSDLYILEGGIPREDFQHIDLSCVNLSGENLNGVEFYGVCLNEAILNKSSLIGANLFVAKLKGADLQEANLSKANLIFGNLKEANLSGANLTEAKLSGANFKDANLSGANLCRATLIKDTYAGVGFKEANFEGTNLSGADLSGIDLSGIDVSKATLIESNLSRANLTGTDLSGLDLTGANLEGTNLSEKNLSRVNLKRANLRDANLQVARLIHANLDGADLTGAYIWEAQRAGWSIKGITCEYVYWDKDAKEKTEYAPGEFERLFSDHTKIRLLYKDGISPLEIATLPALIQHLDDVQGCALRFVNITESAGGAVVELAIENTENLSSELVKQLQGQLQAAANQAVEFERKLFLEAKDRQHLQGRYDELSMWFGKQLQLLASSSPVTIHGDVTMSEEKGDTYNISGQAGAVGKNAHSQGNTFNQIVNDGNSNVTTQVQGERNVVIDGDASDSNIITGDQSE
jgi:uncharacterized protein YjbI with pentapeptide repeats